MTSVLFNSDLSVSVEVQVGEGAWVVAGGLGTDEVGNGGEN